MVLLLVVATARCVAFSVVVRQIRWGSTMSLDTLFPHQPTLSAILPNRQGRSKKQLKPVIEHDGRVFVARFEGRPGRFFGATQPEAHRNLQVGGQ